MTERTKSRRMAVDHTLRSSCHVRGAYDFRKPNKNGLEHTPKLDRETPSEDRPLKNAAFPVQQAHTQANVPNQ